MTIWFTSDTHFGHKNIIKYSNRPFDDVEEMNETLIKNWNERVSPKDQIWHLGDFAFLRKEATDQILKRLNGHKHFIRGNHDEIMPELEHHFESVQDYKELRIDGQKIMLFHFPIYSWNKAHRGSWHLHGHCHGNINYANEGNTRIDVGVDCFNYAPVSFEEVREIMKTREFTVVDHHG